MKRRTFVKKSVAASILTPLALTGLINAAGATETGGGGTTGTGGTEYTTVPETWFTTEGTTETLTTIPGMCLAVSGPYVDVNVGGHQNVCWWKMEACGGSAGNTYAYKPCPDATVDWNGYLQCMSNPVSKINLPPCPFGVLLL